MIKYDKNRPCPKCDGSSTKDRWDYYPTKKEYNRKGVLQHYESTPLVRRKCRGCQYTWYELPEDKGLKIKGKNEIK